MKYAFKPLGMLNVILPETAGYWISPTLFSYALLSGTISLQTLGMWRRTFGEMFQRKPQPRFIPTTHYLTSYGTQNRFSA
jgi:hypothetical protein